MDNAIAKLKEWGKKNETIKKITDAIIKRVKESPALAEDVLKNGESPEKMYSYIKDKARSKAVNGCAMIEDETVYEWAEDYFRGKASKAKKSEKAPVDEDDDDIIDDIQVDEVEKKPAAEEKPKKAKPKKEKKEKQDDGFEQLSLFDFM